MKNRIFSALLIAIVALFAARVSTALAAASFQLDPPAFDFSQYFAVSVSGMPLAALVLLIVEAVKVSGLSGKPLFYTSLGIGTVVGVAYEFSALGIPANFAGYFAYAVYGLGLGLLASGGHNYIKRMGARTAAAAGGDPDEELPSG